MVVSGIENPSCSVDAGLTTRGASSPGSPSKSLDSGDKRKGENCC